MSGRSQQSDHRDAPSTGAVKQWLLRSCAYVKRLPRRHVHLHGFDWVLLSAIPVTVGYLTGIIPSLAPPENQAAFIALTAAILTLLTFLMRRRSRRSKIRASLRSELNEHKKILNTLNEKDDLEDRELKFVVYPMDLYKSQASQLGYLTSDEVEAVTTYYATANRLKTSLAKIESNEADVEKLFSLNDDPTLLEQATSKLATALTELGENDC